MPTPSHRSARRRGVILGAALSSRRSKQSLPSTPPPAQSAAPVAATPQADSMTTQLTELKSLLDSGIITQADFDAKKQQILGI